MLGSMQNDTWTQKATPLQAAIVKRRRDLWSEIAKSAASDHGYIPKAKPVGINGYEMEKIMRIHFEYLRRERELDDDRIRRLAIEAAKQEKRDALSVPVKEVPSLAAIIEAVAIASGFSRNELISDRRTKDMVPYRQLCYLLAKNLTLKSFPEIGRAFGGRDHTSILHGVKKVGFLWPQIASNVTEHTPLIEVATVAVEFVKQSDLLPRSKNYRPWKPKQESVAA